MTITPKIDASKFEILIQRRGRDVRWEEAVICSCWNMDTQQPNYACNACGGFGYIHTDPITARGLVMSITQNKDFDETAGLFEIGDAVMTIPKRLPTALPNGNFNYRAMIAQPMFEIGMWDKVTLLDDEYKSSELLVKGVSLYGRPADTLVQDEPTRVKSIQTVDALTGTVTTYAPGTDFVLNGKVIDWQGVNKPAEGATYSVVYFHRPVYTVTAVLPKPRHQDGQDLPRYVALRYKNGGLDRK